MRMIRLIFYFLSIMLTLSAADPSGQVAAQPAVLSAEAENVLRIGDLARIELDSNATTGYTWVAEENEYVTLVSSEYESPDTMMVGAPGTQVLTFLAVKEGSTALVLEYARPWETDTAPAQTLIIKVTVLQANP